MSADAAKAFGRNTEEVQGRAAGARIVKPLQFDANTLQTAGTTRLAAISHGLVGSEGLRAGVMLVRNKFERRNSRPQKNARG